jgi:hypothetical protein
MRDRSHRSVPYGSRRCVESLAAALRIEHNPGLEPNDIRRVLVTTATHLGRQSQYIQFGAGLADSVESAAKSSARPGGAVVQWRPTLP